MLIYLLKSGSKKKPEPFRLLINTVTVIYAFLPILIFIFFNPVKSALADTIISASDNSTHVINVFGSKSLTEWAGSRKTDKFIIEVTVANLASSCMVGALDIKVLYRSTDFPGETAKEYYVEDIYSRGNDTWKGFSNYLDDKRIDGVEVKGTVYCYSPTKSHYISLNGEITNKRGDYNFYFIESGNTIPDFDGSVDVSVSDSIDFGTLFEPLPTEWKGLWRGYPEHAKIFVDGHVLLGPGQQNFSTEEDLGRLEYNTDGWIRFVPNGKPGSLSKYINIRVEYY